MRKVTTALVTASAIGALALTGCESEATTVNDNVTTAADNFEVNRRIVIINGITDAVLFEIEGRCSIKDEGTQLEVLCKVSEGNDDDAYVKHLFGIPDNVTYMVVQLDELNADPWHHRIVIRPETIVPDIDFETSGG